MPHQCTSCGYVFEDGSKAMLSGCPDCGGNTFQFHPKGAPIPEVSGDDDPPEPPEAEGGRVGETVGRATNAVRGLVNRGEQSAGAPDAPDTVDAPGTDAPGADDAAAADASTSGADATASSADATASTADGPADEAPDNRESPAYGHDAEVERTSEREHAPWPSEQDDDAREDAAQASARSEPAAAPSDDEDIIDADAREGNTAEDAAQASARSEFAGPDELPERGESEPVGPSPAPSDGRVVREPTGEQPSLDELREELNEQFESIKIVEPGQYELNLMELYNREEYVVALQENGRYVIQMPDNWLRDRDED